MNKGYDVRNVEKGDSHKWTDRYVIFGACKGTGPKRAQFPSTFRDDAETLKDAQAKAAALEARGFVRVFVTHPGC